VTDQCHLVDQHGRRVTTLRISLTDRCNFRCVYCMPPEGVSYIPRSTYLTRDELVQFARVTAAMGVSRFRLTGGEPLLRSDIVEIVAGLKGVAGVSEVSVTTNASHLARLAAPLREAGLDRINVSLDSLDGDRFTSVALYDDYGRVRDGIEAAIDAGFHVKINVVVLNGMPDEEILAFVRLAETRALEVRFLEFMPLCGTGWRPDLVYPITRVRELVQERYRLQERPRGGHPAERFSIVGSEGHVGFIAPLTEPFCESCSRIRISADGKLRPCLFSIYEADLGPVIKAAPTDAELAAAIREAVWHKPRGSQFRDEPFVDGGAMPIAATPLIRNIGG